MARRSQTELAVLGALSIEPMSGYEVRKAIADSIGHFWRESFGQIYPTLRRLEAEGLVEPAVRGRTTGSQFALTRAGQKRLRQLLAAPIEPTPPRNGLLLRLFFGNHLSARRRRALVEEALAQAEERLATFARIREDIDRQHHDARASRSEAGVMHRLITLSAGVHTAKAQAQWARETLAVLDADSLAP